MQATQNQKNHFLKCGSRANTTTPLQALILLNNGFTLDMAKTIAARLDGPDPMAQAYGLARQRPPTATERAAAEKLLAQHDKTAFCHALLNSNALILVERVARIPFAFSSLTVLSVIWA